MNNQCLTCENHDKEFEHPCEIPNNLKCSYYKEACWVKDEKIRSLRKIVQVFLDNEADIDYICDMLKINVLEFWSLVREN